MITNSQQKKWISSFGNNYTDRNNKKTVKNFDNLYKKQFGFSRSNLNKKYVKFFKKKIQIFRNWLQRWFST